MSPTSKSSATKKSTAQAYAEAVRDTIAAGARKTQEKTRTTSLDAAQRLVQLQQKAFDGVFKVLEKVQDKSEKVVKQTVTHAAWVPEEGKGVVDEWVKTLHGGRVEFQKTVDKSFGLVTDYLKRVQSAAPAKMATGPAPASKPKAKAKKKSAGKKRPAKKAVSGQSAPQ
jgi:polyhydroxyalkanoate synthesis regulator phasin